MRDQDYAMRRLVALAGIVSLTFYANPAFTKEAFDLREPYTGEPLNKENLEYFDSINANHPDFKLKVVACFMMDIGTAGFPGLARWHTGKTKHSLIFAQDQHDKFTVMLEEFLGKKLVKSDGDGEAMELGKTLFLSIVPLGYEAVRQVCSSAFLDMEKSMNNESQSDSSQKAKDSDTHADCLDAKDYEGCMKFNQSRKRKNQATDLCEGNLCLVRSKGNDTYGLPKPFNYIYKQLEDGRLMYWSWFYRIPHKGQEARYIGFKRITRAYRSPKAGTPGRFIGGGSTYTDCTGYMGKVGCTTTGSSPTYIQGRSATPGGIVNYAFTQIFDCKDLTIATYKNEKLTGRWEKYNPGEVSNGKLKDKCDTGATELKKLPILGLKL